MQIIITLAVAILTCGPALAGLAAGLDALRHNDFGRAAKELRPLAEPGDPEAQYRLGLMYEFGRGYPWTRHSPTRNMQSPHAAATRSTPSTATTSPRI
ncbi:MAG: hypothetical protein ABI881_09030 [Betaproteobacteria bacterium]